jgi:HlyD family secretion protein
MTDGLAADARVVATGGGFLAEGDTVRVVEAPPGMAGAAAPAIPRATPPRP